MKKIIIVSSAVFLLSSCGLYNKYERPDVNTTGLIRDVVVDNDTLPINTDPNFGQLPWREVFTDPQLQQLIETALENNTDLCNAALNVQMMQDMLKVAKLAFLPSVAFAPSGTLSHLYIGIVERRPLWQHPLAEALRTDAAPDDQGLSSRGAD